MVYDQKQNGGFVDNKNDMELIYTHQKSLKLFDMNYWTPCLDTV